VQDTTEEKNSCLAPAEACPW